MARYSFGVGDIMVLGSDGISRKVGTLQELSLEFSVDNKELFGNAGYALTVANGKRKIEGKIGFADIDANIYNQLFFGESAVAVGSKVPVRNEALTIPAGTPWTATPANAGAGKFVMDTGVYFVATGVQLTPITTGAPTTGQYKIDTATGLYTFASADANKAVLVNYIYNDTANGQTINITNRVMDVAPTFQLTAYSKYDSKNVVMQLYSVTADKLNMPFKLDDYSIRDISFAARDNGNGLIGYISVN